MLLRLTPWAVWLALVVFSVATYAGLPEAIPRHFDGGGVVTSSAPRSLANWMLIPGVALFVGALLGGLGALLPSQPELFNFSQKKRFLALPPAFRGPVIQRMRETLDVIAAVTMLLLLAVQVMIWRAALGIPPRGLTGGLIAFTVGFTPLVVLLTLRVNSAVDEAERRWKASGAADRPR